jgi:hypothetical protein
MLNELNSSPSCKAHLVSCDWFTFPLSSPGHLFLTHVKLILAPTTSAAHRALPQKSPSLLTHPTPSVSGIIFLEPLDTVFEEEPNTYIYYVVSFQQFNKHLCLNLIAVWKNYTHKLKEKNVLHFWVALLLTHGIVEYMSQFLKLWTRFEHHHHPHFLIHVDFHMVLLYIRTTKMCMSLWIHYTDLSISVHSSRTVALLQIFA